MFLTKSVLDIRGFLAQKPEFSFMQSFQMFDMIGLASTGRDSFRLRGLWSSFVGHSTVVWFSCVSRISDRVVKQKFRPTKLICATSARVVYSAPVGIAMNEDQDNVQLKDKLKLPEVFLEFLKRNDVDPAVYYAAQNTPRYIRLKSEARCKALEIEEDLGVKLQPLPWLPGFYSIPADVAIAGTESYRLGKIYGMDAASGAAVAALNIGRGDHVLDLCAAPGAKLCMMADLLQDSGTLTATDISKSRLTVTRAMLLKYGLGSRCRLFLKDGTAFSLLPCRESKDDANLEGVGATHGKDLDERTGKLDRPTGVTYVDSEVYGKWKARMTAKEKKSIKRLKYLEDALDRVGGRESELLYYGNSSGIVGMKVSDVFRNLIADGEALENGYDKVLVDAECTHDGSLKHIFKYEQWGWDTFERRFFNADRISSITSLQLRLLSNGFRLLKMGGALVYSTCSFTVAQNEDVIRNFLALHPHAELNAVNAASDWPCKAGAVLHSIRFDPVVSKTSGLFIAKIVRAAA